MCRTRILHTVVAALIVSLSAGFASAQSAPRAGRGWSARALAAQGQHAKSDAPVADRRDADQTEDMRGTENAKAAGIVGTWRVAIPQSAGGLPPFNAYQTFHEGGTFTEVSDLLTTQTESPAHGTWSGKKSDYQLTFELFVFDPETKVPVGRVRVRCAIRLSADGDSFTSNSVVDFIDNDGVVAEGVDSGPFTGTRVKVVPISGT